MKKTVCILCVVLLIMTLFISVAYAKKYVYSNSDVKLIARVVYAEAGHQPFLGKAAVALVVINRYESGKYGRKLSGVVRPGQFVKSARTTQSCLSAVRWALQNRVLPRNTFYFQRSKRTTWQGRPSIIRYCRIGAHTFYTLGSAMRVKGKRYINRNGKLVER